MINPMMNQQYPYANPYARLNQNSINWVQGIEGAKAYVLQPKESVVLMDSESDNLFFIKVCDDIGKCSLHTYRYEEVSTDKPDVDVSQYVKKSELEALLNQMLGGKDESAISTVKSAK